jgi:serine/threonine-protein kinase HipA
MPSAPYEVPLLFQDSAPDGWGRSVLNRTFPNQFFGMAEYLAAAGDDRTGFLRFGATPERGPEQWLPDGGQVPSLVDVAEDLDALVAAAEAVDEGQATAVQLHLLFRSSVDFGGARPKARTRKGGESFIAKFPASGDAFDDPRMEAVCLSLARHAGIEVPQHQIVDIAGRTVLLVQRFDRTAEGFRIGYMSAGTLMGAAPADYRSDAGYADVAAKAREVGIVPCEGELFRRLLFNAFIHNTDDHLRNHAFIGTNEMWRLSPAFDLVPNRQSHMVLRPAYGFDPAPDPIAALDAHAAFRMERRDAGEIYDAVAAAMSSLRDCLDLYRVGARDRETAAAMMPFAFNPPLRPRS